MQEFCIFDKASTTTPRPTTRSTAAIRIRLQVYYIQAALFGTKSNELANCINGVFSTNGLVFGQQSPTPVADYTPVARQAILGWRNSDALRQSADLPRELRRRDLRSAGL